MRLHLIAVGRGRRAPEAGLVEDYRARTEVLARGLGFSGPVLSEIDERKATTAEAQSTRLIETAGRAHILALDERGAALTSPAFAALLARLRDAGTPETALLLGGADGHTEALRTKAHRLIGFGPMVWPHMLARVMLAEQLYRALSILAATPYHRG
ncbi:MAG: 23S rRNA (pseudouridine(1915)-N(3))-methyltransferase RlmH [Pseudomonadota bacterium]